MFPLSDLLKSEVKVKAKQIGMDRLTQKKESTGICFVGNRNFKEFIKEVHTFFSIFYINIYYLIKYKFQYIISKPGQFVDIDTDQVVGQHEGIHQWTVGQRCHLASFLKPYFVAKKDVGTNTIYVASGHDHLALLSDKIFTNNVNWLCGDPFENPHNILECQFRFQHTKPLVKCRVYRKSLHNQDELIVLLENPLRAVTPGQYAVFYTDKECLGSARIVTTTNVRELISCTLENS